MRTNHGTVGGAKAEVGCDDGDRGNLGRREDLYLPKYRAAEGSRGGRGRPASGRPLSAGSSKGVEARGRGGEEL